jgi:hypothetical protein
MSFLTTTMRLEVIDEHFKMSLDRLLVDVKLETVSFNHIELDRELKHFCQSHNLLRTLKPSSDSFESSALIRPC